MKIQLSGGRCGHPHRGRYVPANRHDSPLLTGTLNTSMQALGGLSERARVHLDRGFNSNATRERLKDRGLIAEISEKGKPAPLWAG